MAWPTPSNIAAVREFGASIAAHEGMRSRHEMLEREANRIGIPSTDAFWTMHRDVFRRLNAEQVQIELGKQDVGSAMARAKSSGVLNADWIGDEWDPYLGAWLIPLAVVLVIIGFFVSATIPMLQWVNTSVPVTKAKQDAETERYELYLASGGTDSPVVPPVGGGGVGGILSGGALLMIAGVGAYVFLGGRR